MPSLIIESNMVLLERPDLANRLSRHHVDAKVSIEVILNSILLRVPVEDTFDGILSIEDLIRMPQLTFNDITDVLRELSFAIITILSRVGFMITFRRYAIKHNLSWIGDDIVINYTIIGEQSWVS